MQTGIKGIQAQSIRLGTGYTQEKQLKALNILTGLAECGMNVK
jgi:hypothetical protein